MFFVKPAPAARKKRPETGAKKNRIEALGPCLALVREIAN